MTIRFVTIASAILLIALGGGGHAQDAVAPSAAKTHAEKTFQVLDPASFDPSRLLPAPPTDGGERQKAELAEVRRAYGIIDVGRKAQAKWDNDHEDPSLFAPTLGQRFDMAKLPATARLLALVRNEASVASGVAKRHFRRTRPWAEDHAIIPCDYAPGADPATSYPSGHTTLGYSLAVVLANLIPEKAPAILERASDYGYSREICGDHFPSDTEAGHVLGTLVAARLLSDPKVTDRLEAARAELRSAGLAER
jgi:acid phosphatase (class A)